MDRKHTTYLLLGGASALLVFALASAPRHKAVPPVSAPPPPAAQQQEPPPVSGKPRVDVVFVLDTTGSMSGLLEGAKKKIWEIARFIAQGQPAPDLRVGLVAYRDIGDEYVTRFFDLTEDLDAVYQNLSAFTAAGGGDAPEHVAKALFEAVNRSSWTIGAPGRAALRLVYLVGDAPPHTDYNDGYDYHAIAQQAGERGIRINTIRCGRDSETEVAWREIARRGHGDYHTIGQGGDVVETSTPYDDELAGLNRRLLGTALGYGSAERQAELRARTEGALAAPKAVQAERAGLFGLFRSKGKVAATSSADLLADVADRKVALDSMPAAALPEPMQKMSAADRQRFVEDKARERKEVLEQINAASARRDAYLRHAARPAGGFDGKVRESLKKQAADVGLKY